MTKGKHTTPNPRRQSRPLVAGSSRARERGLTALTLVAVLAALGLTGLLLRQSLDPLLQPALSFVDALQRNLVMTRVALSMLMVVAWPLVLHGAAEYFKLQFKQTDRFLTLTALLIATITYDVYFLPGNQALACLLVPLVLSPFLFKQFLRMKWGQVIRLWMSQIVLLGFLLSFAAWTIESIAMQRPLNLLREIPIAYGLINAPKNAGTTLFCGTDSKPFPAFYWESSGSDWIDVRVNQAQVVAYLSERKEEWTISLSPTTQGQIIEGTYVNHSSWHSERFTPAPQIVHTVNLNLQTQSEDQLQIYSLLPVKVRTITP